MGKLLNILILVVLGVMLAGMLNNATGTKTIFDGIGGLWSTSLNGLLGKSSKG